MYYEVCLYLVIKLKDTAENGLVWGGLWFVAETLRYCAHAASYTVFCHQIGKSGGERACWTQGPFWVYIYTHKYTYVTCYTTFCYQVQKSGGERADWKQDPWVSTHLPPRLPLFAEGMVARTVSQRKKVKLATDLNLSKKSFILCGRSLAADE